MTKQLVVALMLCVVAPCSSATDIPSPAEFFGHPVGADHTLIPYPDVLAYLETVAAVSDRVAIENAGRSTLGNTMEIVILTSPENQGNLDRLREIAKLLAKPGDLSPEASRSSGSSR